MKGKEGTRDSKGQEAKSPLASSARGLDISADKGFFADAKSADLFHHRNWVAKQIDKDRPVRHQVTASGQNSTLQP